MTITIGDSAFPLATGPRRRDGLTKREYFAAAAMTGLLAHGYSPEAAAGGAVMAADKLVRELNASMGGGP